MKLCEYNFGKFYENLSRSTQKYMRENPLCKTPPTYEGYCEKHIPYKMRRERDYNDTPHETRQEYLDLIHQGKTIGEAREIAGITLDVAMEITNRAIGAFHYLKREAE